MMVSVEKETNRMRNILFVGHANPQDNEFSEWIASRLELEGYSVWLDLKNLYGGERDFWNDIQITIRDNAIKYLLVYSSSTFTKDGVADEYEYARSIEKQNSFKDFVIPLRIENVQHNLRIGINRKNIIEFSESWADGLKKLFKKLEIDNVPKLNDKNKSISDWIKNKYVLQRGIHNRKELYYSNWWPISEIPERIFLFQYRTDKEAKMIIEEDADYSVIIHGNFLISFEKDIKTICAKNDNIVIKPESTEEILTKNIIKGFESIKFPYAKDAQHFIKRLLKKGLINLMYKKGLIRKELSKKQYCFVYPLNKLSGNKLTFSYHNRKKTKNLVGRYSKYFFWHFGVSANVLIEPFLCYNLKSHVLFSDDGYRLWTDSNRLHRARRAKCRMWFNEEWRDLLIGFINSLTDDTGNIKINLTNDFSVNMPLCTEIFSSHIGYDQPNSKDRLLMLEEYFEEVNALEVDDAE